MKDGPNIARIAALIGDHARAEMLTALLAGQALTATELAQVAGVTKQTVSAHLAKLLEAQLLAVESQGRHRYFRLADRDVAAAARKPDGRGFPGGRGALRPGPREPALRKARVCYDHLAGELGVLRFDSLEQRRAAHRRRRDRSSPRPGARFFAELGIDVDALARERRAAVPRLPRLEHAPPSPRRLGRRRAAAALLELGWAKRAKGSRVVSFSASGEKALRARFSLPS